MKENRVKKFVKEHGGEIALSIGVIAVAATWCAVGYKLGDKHGFERFGNAICKHETVMDFIRGDLMSNNCYVGLLGDKNVKFKDLGELAKEAIDLDPLHLEDIVTGMFVTTIHKA